MPSHAVDRTWDGGAGTTNYLTAQNWSADALPTSGDNALINSPSVTLTASGAAASELRIASSTGGTTTMSISGSGALTSSSTSYVGYGTNSNGTLNITNGGRLTSTDGRVAHNGGATAIATIDGAGSLWTITGGIIIANVLNTNGTMNIQNGGAMSVGNTLLVGNNDGTNGTLNILSGGTLTSISGRVGFTSGANGAVVVSGSGSNWTNTGGLSIGNAGTGTRTMTISNGGTVVSSVSAVSSAIGAGSGSDSAATGTVTIDGAGSQWTATTGDFYIGNFGTGTLNIQNGGKFTGVSPRLGNNLTGQGTLKVTGSGSILNSTAALYVGNLGKGTLNILNGGVINNTGATTDALIGAGSTASGTAVVDGTGSQWNVTRYLYVGSAGQGDLTVSNGGKVSALQLRSGHDPTAVATVTVTDSGSTLDLGSTTYVGNLGSSTLKILNGGVVNINGTNFDALVGNGSATNSTASGTVVVDGAGSDWNISRYLYVGSFGQGDLTVSNGGRIDAVAVRIGYSGAGSIGTMTITDAGSQVNTTSGANIGNLGSATLDILNGGVFNAGNTGTSNDNIRVGGGGTSATVNVSGAGSQFNAHRNFLIGQTSLGTVNVSDGGYISNGTIQLGNATNGNGLVTIKDAGSKWDAGNLLIGGVGTGVLNIRDGAVVSALNGNTSSVIGDGVGVSTGSGTININGSGALMELGHHITFGKSATGNMNILNAGVAQSAGATLGDLAGSHGNITIDGVGSLWDVSNTDMTIGKAGAGTLTVSNDGALLTGGHTINIASAIGSTGTLNIGADSVSAAEAPGTVEASQINFGSGLGTIVFNHTGTHYEFAADIVGNGTLSFIGGNTVLTGDNSGFIGTTNFTGGTLRVNGQLAGTTVVSDDGRLMGSGGFGDIIVNNGGVAAPGNSIGTMSVVNASFTPGSIYEVEVNSAGQSDLIDASGTATLTGGTVQVIPFPDYVANSPYTILTAAGGVTGTFDGTAATSFINAVLSYNANNVFVTLTSNATALMNAAATPNQSALASAIGSVTGSNTAIGAVLASASNAEARSALDMLSGELHASLAAAQIKEQNQLRAVAQKRRPDRTLVQGDDRYWVSAFGEKNATDATGNTASVSHRTGGLLIGAEHAFENAYAGFGLGESRTSIDIDGRGSKADSTNYHLITYGGTELGNGLSVDGGASFTWHDIDTQRNIALAGFNDTGNADYNAQTAQIFASLNRAFVSEDTTITPHIDGAYIYHRARNFREDGEAGLESDATGNAIGLTTIGVDAARTVILDQKQITIEGGLGWQHVIGDNTMESDVAFRDEPASAFTVSGAPVARNALLFDVGAQLDIAPGVKFSVEYGGSFSPDARDHNLAGQLGIAF